MLNDAIKATLLSSSLSRISLILPQPLSVEAMTSNPGLFPAVKEPSSSILGEIPRINNQHQIKTNKPGQALI